MSQFSNRVYLFPGNRVVSPEGVLHFRRANAALRTGDSARIVLPNVAGVKRQLARHRIVLLVAEREELKWNLFAVTTY